MSIRRRILAILAVSLAVLVASVCMVMLAAGRNVAEERERTQFQGEIRRALAALAHDVVTLDHAVADYASRKAVLAFAEGQGKAAKPDALLDELLARSRVEFAVVADPSGQVLLGKCRDLQSGRSTLLPDGLADHLQPGRPLVGQSKPDGGASGVLDLPGGPILLASRPVCRSDRGIAHGALIAGRRLDDAEVDRLSRITRLPLHIRRIADHSVPPRVRPILASLSPASPMAVRAVNDAKLEGYGLVRDIYGKPALAVCADGPREHVAAFMTNVRNSLVSVLVIGLILGAGVIVLVDKLVLARLAKLSTSVMGAAAGRELAARLPLFGSDEISELGRAIRRMLDSLDRQVGQRARTAKALQQFRRIFEGGAAGIIIATWPDLRFSRTNPAFCRMTGYDDNELQQLTALDIIHPDDLPNERQTIRQAIDAGRTDLQTEMRYLTKSGDVIWVNLSGWVAAGEPGQPPYLLAIVEDITERRKLEEKYLQAQKMEAIGRLAGGVAHDFNNLLTAIMGYSDYLMENLRLRGEHGEALAEIQKAGKRAGELTRQLLAFARRQVLEPKVLDISALLDGLEKMIRRLIGDDVHLTVVRDPGVWPVRADPGQIEQVVMNLAVNARDAMVGGGILTIETANCQIDEDFAAGRPGALAGPYVRLTVSDTGCGMDSETMQHLFEPFFTTKEVGKGTGLGLATVFGIVQQSGGFIDVQSRPGQGAVFHVYLPRAETAAGSDSPPVDEPDRSELPGTETVLVVEDADAVRRLAASALKRYGYTVLTAVNAGEALLICERHPGPVHLMLADVIMPLMNGYELYDRVAGIRPEMRILYMSGYPDLGAVRQPPPAAALLIKPFTAELLARRVRAVLDSDSEGMAAAMPSCAP